MTAQHDPGSVLMVAYHYPPIATAGTHRTLNFARELDRMGWKVTVVSSNDLGRHPLDPGLLKRIGDRVRVRRAFSTDLVESLAGIRGRMRGKTNGSGKTEGGGQEASTASRKPSGSTSSGSKGPGATHRSFADFVSRCLKTPDSMLPFVAGAVWKALPEMLRHRPDVIYSSAPPFSGHLAAWCLKRLFAVPWVADFRDPWADNPFRKDMPYASLRRFDTCLENLVAESADVVLCNTPALEEAFRARYPWLDRFRTLTNGFAPALLSPDPDPAAMRFAEREAPIRIVHTGEIYGLRSPVALIRALGELGRDGTGVFENLAFEFYGAVHDEDALKSLAAEEGVAKALGWMGRVDHRAALKHCREGDILLILGVKGDRPEMQVPQQALRVPGPQETGALPVQAGRSHPPAFRGVGDSLSAGRSRGRLRNRGRAEAARCGGLRRPGRLERRGGVRLRPAGPAARASPVGRAEGVRTDGHGPWPGGTGPRTETRCVTSC